MKILIPAIVCSIVLSSISSCKKNPSSPSPSNSDSFAVTVNNGYGIGQYKPGDTVHIFSKAWPANQRFGKWTGDIPLLNASDEWHSWFIMPAKNVSFTGNFENSKDFSIQYEQIKGRDRLKPVYYYFPQEQKGIVYLLHGTNGNAANILAGYEWKQLIKDLINNNFAVIITEAEEATTEVDENGDGKLKWTLLPADTITNVDFANIRAITDTFYSRGLANRNAPRYSVGMSDGGFFSAALSYIYHFKASIQYCSQGSDNLMQTTDVPTQFCMAANDDNPSIGAAGNAEALANSKNMNARGVCSKYFVNERSPLYPERFAQNGVITLAQSTDIFNELKSKDYIDSRNYYIGYSDKLISDLKSNPANFPVIKNLTPDQFQSMLQQINIAVADHHIYSDYDRATLKFLNNQCQ